jgi:N-methylhydantoinase A
MALCLGIDVGGTFTDAVLTDGSKVWRAKSPTVAADLGQSVLDATTLLAQRAGSTLPELLPRIARFGLGTTAVTNVLTARTGVRVGLVTTAGFEDSLPLAKGRRVSDGIWSVYPEAIVPRERIMGVRERVDRDGHVLMALDPEAAVEAASRNARWRPWRFRFSGPSRIRITNSGRSPQFARPSLPFR